MPSTGLWRREGFLYKGAFYATMDGGRRSMTPDDLERLRSDPASWRGFPYVCKDDPRLIVPMRPRWMGYAMNLAHGAAIPVLLAIIVVLMAPMALVFFVNPLQAFIGSSVLMLLAVAILIILCHWEATRPR